MKQSIFSITLFSIMVLLITGCGGNEQKTTTNTTKTDSTTAVATQPTPPVTTASGIVTTPQNMTVITHRVSNFTKWKAAYEGHDSARLASGLHNYVIGRGVEDSNMVMVALKTDDLSKAKAFSKDPGLKKAMDKGGVVGKPTIRFVTLVFQDTSVNAAATRAMNTFTVKDWDTWKKAFDSGKQMRMDNGLTDRAYGYDADDNHKVIVVVAVNDSAKANAFWKSDMLKQKRAESGVVGKVDRFLYRLAQRY